MRIFIAGATGVLGRSLLPMLVKSGHRVVALARSAEKEKLVRGLGGFPVTGDILNLESLKRATEGCQGVVHIATAIPNGSSGQADWRENDRVRTEGTRHLLSAAQQNGASVYVQQSIVFPYGNHGDEWIDESTPFSGSVLEHLQSAVEMEELVRSANVRWRILRGGSFYGPGTRTTEDLIHRAKQGSLQIQGDGMHYMSLIHVYDMAQAIQLALQAVGQNGVYNVVDDEPVRQRELFEFIAGMVGRPVSNWDRIANPVLSLRCSNRRLRADLGFEPRYPNYEIGYREVWKSIG